MNRRINAPHLVLLITVVTVWSFSYSFNDSRAQEAIEDSATLVRVGDAAVSSNLVVNNAFIDPEHHCEGCTRIVYTPGSQDQAGIAYKDNKLNVGSSQRLVFFAKGQPNEQVAFVAAGNDTTLSTTSDTDIFPRINFSIVTEKVTLKNDWQRFEIGLNDTALSGATYPFGIQFSADSTQKQVFYIKGITLNGLPAQNPLPTSVDLLNSTSVNTTGILVSASIINNLTAQIISNGTNYPAPATIGFEANTTGGSAPYSFSWNYGDGSNGTEIGEKVLHTFDKAGEYTINLVAKDSSSPSQNASASMQVTITSPTNKTESPVPFTAQIISNGTNYPAPSTVAFEANTTGGWVPYSFSWNFGDGSNGTKVGEKVSHTFDKSGQYTVTLAVKDSSIPSQNALATTLVTMISSANKLAPNSTISNDANSTISNDANSTISNDANSTVSNDANSTVSNDANSTVSNDANSTVSNDANSTVSNDAIKETNATNRFSPVQVAKVETNNTISALQARSEITNGTDPNVQAAIVFEGASGEQASTPKVEGKQVDNLTTAVGEKLRVDGTNAAEVISVNNPPVAIDQSVIMYANKATNIVLKGTDPDNDPVTFELVSDPSKGVLAGFKKETGAVIYIPNPIIPGSDRFTFKVIDTNNAESNLGRVEIINPIVTDNQNVETDIGHSRQSTNSAPAADNERAGTDLSHSRQSTNSAPVAGNEKIRIDQNKNARIALQGMDIDHDKLTYSIINDPSQGKIIAFDSFTGKITYRPDRNFAGQDSFTYKVTDQKGLDSNDAKVEIKVTGDMKKSELSLDNSAASADTDNSLHAVNRNPSVNAGPDRAVYGGTKSIILIGTGEDTDGDLLTYSWKQIAGPRVILKDPNSAQTTFKIQAENTVLGFELTASDGKGGQASDDVSIIIKDPVEHNQLNRDKIQINISNQSSQENQ